MTAVNVGEFAAIRYAAASAVLFVEQSTRVEPHILKRARRSVIRASSSVSSAVKVATGGGFLLITIPICFCMTSISISSSLTLGKSEV